MNEAGPGPMARNRLDLSPRAHDKGVYPVLQHTTDHMHKAHLNFHLSSQHQAELPGDVVKSMNCDVCAIII